MVRIGNKIVIILNQREIFTGFISLDGEVSDIVRRALKSKSTTEDLFVS